MKSIVKKAGDDCGKLYKIVSTFIQQSDPNAHAGAMIGSAYKSQTKHNVLSDTVVRSTEILDPQNPQSTATPLFFEMHDVAWVQAMMIFIHGIPIRGAMTVGDIYRSGEMIFGPGLVNAHEQETKLACFPRVIVDPALLQVYEDVPTLRAHHNSLARDRSFLQDLLRRDSDACWFLDYIWVCLDVLDDNIATKRAFLWKHRQVIIDGLLQNEGDLSVSAKYKWMMKYHNSYVRERTDWFFDSHLEIGRDRILIRPEDVGEIGDVRSEISAQKLVKLNQRRFGKA